MVELEIKNLEDTKRLATIIGQHLNHENVNILLSGDLAAGKTTFTKALLASQGITELVTSPTFVIMNQYETIIHQRFNHMDAYRLLNLDHSDEWAMYLEEFEGAINIIEWPSVIERFLDPSFLTFKLNFINVAHYPEERRVQLSVNQGGVEDAILHAFRN